MFKSYNRLSIDDLLDLVGDKEAKDIKKQTENMTDLQKVWRLAQLASFSEWSKTCSQFFKFEVDDEIDN